MVSCKFNLQSEKEISYQRQNDKSVLLRGDLESSPLVFSKAVKMLCR